jgi:hypothetical protein
VIDGGHKKLTICRDCRFLRTQAGCLYDEQVQKYIKAELGLQDQLLKIISGKQDLLRRYILLGISSTPT